MPMTEAAHLPSNLSHGGWLMLRMTGLIAAAVLFATLEGWYVLSVRVEKLR